MVGARKAGAECIVTACPLCQANVDTRQKGDKHATMPVFYFTELLGIAFGLSDVRKWLKKHVISPVGFLKKRGLL